MGYIYLHHSPKLEMQDFVGTSWLDNPSLRRVISELASSKTGDQGLPRHNRSKAVAKSLRGARNGAKSRLNERHRRAGERRYLRECNTGGSRVSSP